MLKQKILNKESDILLYGITPPKSNNTKERINEISKKHIKRIEKLPIDGLIIYDIQDETERTKEERPFDFISTVDPSIYSNTYLAELQVPKIVYRCVGNYNPSSFSDWLAKKEDDISVFVGRSSLEQQVELSLVDAYRLRREVNDDMALGAVTIPERHVKNKDEDSRVAFKMSEGCRFFVSQAVYDLEASKSFLMDYKKYCEEKDLSMVPIIFTFTPCGSEKTLKFIKWLGISVPKWLEENLLSSKEMLDKSIEIAINIYKELREVAKQEGIPIGCNIESVSIRKEEIEASIRLANEIEKVHGK